MYLIIYYVLVIKRTLFLSWRWWHHAPHDLRHQIPVLGSEVAPEWLCDPDVAPSPVTSPLPPAAPSTVSLTSFTVVGFTVGVAALDGLSGVGFTLGVVADDAGLDEGLSGADGESVDVGDAVGVPGVVVGAGVGEAGVVGESVGVGLGFGFALTIWTVSVPSPILR